MDTSVKTVRGIPTNMTASYTISMNHHLKDKLVNEKQLASATCALLHARAFPEAITEEAAVTKIEATAEKKVESSSGRKTSSTKCS